MYKNVDDFYLMSWDEYQGIVDKLSCSISKYKNDNGVSFDFIVPVLRGGGVLAISLSHRLNVYRIFLHSISTSMKMTANRYINRVKCYFR